jgi:hypothetical protein
MHSEALVVALRRLKGNMEIVFCSLTGDEQLERCAGYT